MQQVALQPHTIAITHLLDRERGYVVPVPCVVVGDSEQGIVVQIRNKQGKTEKIVVCPDSLTAR